MCNWFEYVFMVVESQKEEYHTAFGSAKPENDLCLWIEMIAKQLQLWHQKVENAARESYLHNLVGLKK